MFKPTATTLDFADIQLRPLTLNDVEIFHHCANDDRIWTWMTPNPCTTLAATEQWITDALNADNSVPFVIIDKKTGQMAGSTRYLNIKPADYGLEIGHTFLNPRFWRTHVNTQNKFCLIRHAFEELKAIRVALRTHEQNQRSRNAIGRIGAEFEGILRNHRIMATGKRRNTAVFSIIDSQWPQVKQQLLNRIKK